MIVFWVVDFFLFGHSSSLLFIFFSDYRSVYVDLIFIKKAIELSNKDLELLGKREGFLLENRDLEASWMDVVDAHGIAEAYLRLYGGKRKELLSIYEEFTRRLREFTKVEEV